MKEKTTEQIIKEYQDYIIWQIPKIKCIEALEAILMIIRRYIKD